MLNFFGVTFHAYGLFIGLGVVVGLYISMWTRSRYEEDIEKAFVYMTITGVIGARAYHVIDYWERYYSTNLVKILALWEGGLGIWGAIIGSVAGLYIYCYLNKKSILPIMDGFASGAPAAQAIGRLGNWANNELVGRNGEPLFAYEATLNIVLLVILLIVGKRTPKHGQLTGIYLLGYGTIRVILENLRPNDVIWRVGELPVAIIFGIISILIGGYLITVRHRSEK